jgi:hypothetical protein
MIDRIFQVKITGFFAVLFAIVSVLLLNAESARNKKWPQKTSLENIYLSADTLTTIAVDRAKRGGYTRIHQIDIVEQIFLQFRYDERIVDYGNVIIIPGKNFATAHERSRPFFKSGVQNKGSIVQPKMKLPEINYANFKGIGLSYENGENRMSIRLKKSYIQEIPHTFGASIRLNSRISSTLRTGDDGRVIEVVFDNYKSVHFFPPSFIFFIPKMYVKVASIRRKDGNIYGYVIGRPKSMPHKFCAVGYNLSTCAKTSIKNYSLSPYEYEKKLDKVDYFGFAE